MSYVIFIGIPILFSVMVISYAPWILLILLMVAEAKKQGWYIADIGTAYCAFFWYNITITITIPITITITVTVTVTITITIAITVIGGAIIKEFYIIFFFEFLEIQLYPLSNYP